MKLFDPLLGCCKVVDIVSHIDYIMVNNYKFKVVIVYCKNCGSMKSNSHIQEDK